MQITFFYMFKTFLGTITIPPKQSQPQSRQASNLDKMETAPQKNIAKMGLIESIISGVSEDDIKSNFFTTTNTAESGPESEELAKYLGITENPIVNESKKIMIFNIIYL